MPRPARPAAFDDERAGQRAGLLGGRWRRLREAGLEGQRLAPGGEPQRHLRPNRPVSVARGCEVLGLFLQPSRAVEPDLPGHESGARQANSSGPGATRGRDPGEGQEEPLGPGATSRAPPRWSARSGACRSAHRGRGLRRPRRRSRTNPTIAPRARRLPALVLRGDPDRSHARSVSARRGLLALLALVEQVLATLRLITSVVKRIIRPKPKFVITLSSVLP